MKRHRPLKGPEPIEDLVEFASVTSAWWLSIQVHSEGANYAFMKVAGPNGLFILLLCLSWWIAAAETDEERAAANVAVSDVLDAVKRAVSSVRSPPPSPAPASSASSTPEKRKRAGAASGNLSKRRRVSTRA